VRIGAENRQKVILASVLGALAVLLLLRWLFTSSNEPASAAPPAATAPAVTARTATPKKKGSLANSLDPTLRFDWLKQSEDRLYEGKGQNIFTARAEVPVPLGNGTTDHANVAPAPAPAPQVYTPPPPPPINLKFYGFASSAGEPKKVFLSEGDDIFIAGEGDIVDRRYKVLHISPMSVEVEDVLNNNRQQIPLTQG
jgi:hypothetical protein